MSETDPLPETPTPTRSARRVAAVLLVALAVLAVGMVALLVLRKPIAREVASGWLQSRGIASQLEIQRFGLTGVTGRLRVGDPSRPDVVVEQAEIGYGLRGLSLEVRTVRLVRPVVRARLHGGQLSVGSLDPLIAEFRKRPPRPDARKPRIRIDDGVVLLATDYGLVRIAGDATVNDGRLASLAATTAPARLRGPGFDLALGAGRLGASSRTNRFDAVLDVPAARANVRDVTARDGRLRLTLQGPYPDLEKKRGEGDVVVRATLTAGELALGNQSLGGAELAAAFQGRTRGWIDTLEVSGDATVDLRAARGGFGAGRAEGLRVSASATDVRWTRAGGDRLRANFQARGALDGASAGDLRLQRVNATASGPIAASKEGVTLALSAGASGHGAWLGLGAPTRDDTADMAAVKRAVRGFAFSAPALALKFGGEPSLALGGPVVLRPDTGGQVRLAPAGGAYDLAMSGGGLPAAQAQVTRFALVNGGAVAAGRAHAALSIGPLQDGVFDASGELRIQNGVRFTADRCVDVRAARVELGVNDVEALAGQICPDGRPTLTLKDGWRIAGRAQGVSAAVPFLQARVTEAAGPISLGQVGGQLTADARLTVATVHDTAPTRRFNLLRMTGEASLAREQWRANLAFRTPAGAQVATAALRHDGRTGAGAVDIDSGQLAFADGGLQPEQLSPLASAVASPAEGQARFTGGFAWTKAGTTSQGVLDVPRLDFNSPAGRVTGLSGRLVFSSLSPLAAAPGQVLRAEGVASGFAPLTGVTTTFSLQDEAVRITGGEAQVGGGRVIVESLDVPLDPKKAVRGVLVFDGVQLHDLVETSPFGDKVDLNARVSGRVPFTRQNDQIRITEGSLRAIEPGRISIQRSALSGVAAEGGVATPAGAPTPEAGTDTFTDFAYQAMENLAFDTLDASISSRENGRLGVLFHINGKHDPPQKQEIRLTWLDLIRRNFMNRKLPLPSGTGVNLTLDTSLNLDELLGDYEDYQRLRSSGAVQPR